MVEAPEATPQEKECRSVMVNTFSQRTVLLFDNEQDNEAMLDLPFDMKLEAFTIGVLTGLLSTLLQITSREDWNAVIESVTEYIPHAAEQAQRGIDDAKRGVKPQ